MLAEFESMGITTLEHLEELGFDETARRWIEHYPERLNVNAFIGIVATLDGIAWTEVSASQRAKARSLVNQIRRELSLPLVKKAKDKSTIE